MSLEFTLGACILSAGSGLPGLMLPRRSPLGQIAAVLLLVVGAAAGLIGAMQGLISGATESLTFPGPLPNWTFQIQFDALTAFFLVPIFLLGAAGSIYGLKYWRQAEHARNGCKLSLFYGLLVAGLGMVTMAADGFTFLVAWEIMALSAFFLVSTEDHKHESRRAGWVYLVATHIGTLTLFALFALLRAASGSFELRRLQPDEAGIGMQTIIFLVALVGFSLKAGVMPLHFWLPNAHASSPSHVSAMLSGVMLKIGVYGLLRTLTLLPHLPLVCGFLVLILGVISALLGVAFALGQHDLKRLLAYHSIENIGIIFMGIGLAIIGLAADRSEWVILGMAGALLHVWNHGLFKSLLFLAAGSVVHAVHTREIDQLGGLGKSMPRTASLFAIGSAAICGLPPLNGFISELIIYLGLFRAAIETNVAFCGIALAAPALATVGALAVACFVKAYGTVFLGTARTPEAEHAHESAWSMILPMALIASLCIAIGMFPILVLPLLDRVITAWPGFTASSCLENLVPYSVITTLNIALVLTIAIAIALIRRQLRRQPARQVLTWDCGYLRPRSSMQYTSSSFAGMLVGLLRWILRPKIAPTPPAGIFPGHSAYESHVPDVVLDGFLNPTWQRIKSYLASLRVLQQGSVQSYLFYILLALFAMLLTLVPVMDLARKLLGR